MRPILLIPALLLVLACKSPQAIAVAEQNKPVAVVLSLPATVADRARVEAIYADELRQQLAGRVSVVAAQGGLPPEAARLLVTLSVDSDVVGKEAGASAAYGDSVGTAYSLGSGKGFLPAVGDGLLTGVVFGAIGSAGSGIAESSGGR